MGLTDRLDLFTTVGNNFTVGTDDGNTCAAFQARFGDNNETFTALKEPLCGRGWESHIFFNLRAQ